MIDNRHKIESLMRPAKDEDRCEFGYVARNGELTARRSADCSANCKNEAACETQRMLGTVKG